MEQRFEFDGAEVQALLEETREAVERLMTEAQEYLASGVDLLSETAEIPEEIEGNRIGAPPGLWLMNDRGVYLRSNANKPPSKQVAYARGYRAEVQVGDESMCEFIDAIPLEQLRPDDTLVVTVTEQKLRLSVIREP